MSAHTCPVCGVVPYPHTCCPDEAARPRRRAADVGDLDSSDKGTGARFNGEKPPFQYLPFKRIADSLEFAVANEQQAHVRKAVAWLGAFQCGDDLALSKLLAEVARACGMTMRELLAETAHVLEFGAKKYKDWNWAKGMAWSVCIACIGRHLLGDHAKPGMWDDARSIDPDSQRMHAGCVGANVMFLLEYMTTYREGDDRPQELRT